MCRTPNPATFLFRDEDGSATVWSLFWTLIFLFLAGISIDTSNAYRFRAALQATADASSVGALMGYIDEDKYQTYTGDLIPQTATHRGTELATVLAGINMVSSRNGTVVANSNVTFGRWVGGAFSAGATPTNAAQVRALRTGANSNELPTLLLGRFGILSSWDVGATSVAQAYFRGCPGGNDEGIIAGGTLQIASGNLFQGNLCLHGDERVDMNSNNDFQPNAAAEMPAVSYGPGGEMCSGYGNCQTDTYDNVTAHNDNLTSSMIVPEALVMPDVHGMIGDIEMVLADPAAYAAVGDGRNHLIPPSLLTNPDRALGEAAIFETPLLADPATELPIGATQQVVGGVLRIEMSASGFETAVQNANIRPLPANAIYDISLGCTSGNRKLELNANVVIEDVVISTPCRVTFDGDITFRNSTLFSTYDGNNPAIHGSSGSTIGGGTCADGSDGSYLIAAMADVDFAAGLSVNNSQIISGADVDIAAQPNGMEGASILAANDVRLTSLGEWQGCPGSADNYRLQAYSYRIVD